MDGTLIGRQYQLPNLPEGVSLPGKNNRYQLHVLPGQTAQWLVAFPFQPGAPITITHTGNADIRIYALGLVPLSDKKNQYYPDVLIPAQIDSLNHRLHIPSSPLLPEKSQWEVLFVEVPVNHSPLQVTFSQNGQFYWVDIRVLPYSRPSLNFLFNFNEYGDKYLRPFLQKELVPARLLTIERQIFQLFRDHYGELNPLPYKSQKGTLRKGMGPKIINDDLLHPKLDWTQFDRRFGPLFDGSAFPDRQPIAHFYLPFNPNWPAPFKLYSSDRETYEAIWNAFAREFIRHFKEKQWTNTQFFVYMNQKPSPKNNIPWHLDEPKGVKDYKALRYFANLTHRVFSQAQPLKIQFRMDISHFYCQKHRGNPQKDFRINGGWDILAPVVDSWFISIHSLQSITARLKARELMDMGKAVWVYGNTPGIDEPGYLALQSVFFAFNEGWQGMLIWKTFNFSGKPRNGRDCIAYILPLQGNPTLMPSLRLKLLREGYQLMEILSNQQTHGLLSSPAADQLTGLLSDKTFARWIQFRDKLFAHMNSR